MHMKRLNLGYAAVLALALCSVLSLATYADDDTAAPAKPAAKDDGGLLAGPKVDEEPAAPDNPAFAGEDKMRQSVEIPALRWFMVVNELELSDEQSADVKNIASEYQDALRTFRKDHAEELSQLQARMRESRASGNFDPKLRDAYRQVQDQAPAAEPFQDRIYKLLDEQQQADLRERLETLRTEIAERRAKEREGTLDAMRRGGRGDDAMAPGRDGEPMDGKAPTPSFRRDATPAREGVRGGRGLRQPGQGLDAMSRKRFEFLMSKQSNDGRQRPVLNRVRQQRSGSDQDTGSMDNPPARGRDDDGAKPNDKDAQQPNTPKRPRQPGVGV